MAESSSSTSGMFHMVRSLKRFVRHTRPPLLPCPLHSCVRVIVAMLFQYAKARSTFIKANHINVRLHK